MTLSGGVVVAEGCLGMEAMEGRRESARRRVASFPGGGGKARNLRAGGGSGTGALRKRRGPLYASGRACCGDGEMRAQVLVISGWVVNVCEVSLA